MVQKEKQMVKMLQIHSSKSPIVKTSILTERVQSKAKDTTGGIESLLERTLTQDPIS